MRVSLILATYNLPRHLSLVCAGLERQTCRDYEIIICDDGSGPETRSVITEFASRAPVPVKHLWQEDQGNRKSKILNKGIRNSKGEVLVFLDGDCIPHPRFVDDHISMQEEGCYLAGSRVELGETMSRWITPEHIRSGYFDFPRPRLIWNSVRGDKGHFLRTLRVPWHWLRIPLKMNRVIDMKGCNFSVSRQAMLEINGFDASYEGSAREDSDVEVRLLNLGLRIKSIKGLAIQYHVWHPRREANPANAFLLEEVKKSGRRRSLKGLDRN